MALVSNMLCHYFESARIPMIPRSFAHFGCMHTLYDFAALSPTCPSCHLYVGIQWSIYHKKSAEHMYPQLDVASLREGIVQRAQHPISMPIFHI